MSISQGEVWLVNLDPTVGDEIRKMRPAVVVNHNALGNLALRVVVPITGWQERFHGSDWLIRLDPDETNSLEKASLIPFRCDQSRRAVLHAVWAT